MEAMDRSENVPSSQVPEKNATLGVYSYFSLSLALLLMTLIFGINYVNVVTQLFAFAMNDFSRLQDVSDFTFPQSIVYATGVVLFSICFTFLSSSIVQLVFGKSKSFNSEILDKVIERGPLPLFLIVLAEEVIARMFFMGILSTYFPIFFLPFHLSTYIWFLIGNGVWTAIHVFNYKDENERQLIRVLPQFLAGFSFGFLYLQFGFLLTVLAHYYYNVLVLSTRKKQDFTRDNILQAGYFLITGVVAFIGLVLMGMYGTELAAWFNQVEHVYHIENYGFWHYVLILIVVKAACEFSATVFALDSLISENTVRKLNLDISVFVVACFFLFILILGVNWLMAYWISSDLVRAALIAMGLAFISWPRTGSALARSMIVNVPSNYVLILVMITPQLHNFFKFGVLIIVFLYAWVSLYWVSYLKKYDIVRVEK